MAEIQRIPMFPLSIIPLPGELVPLHIFEPRYRELLLDMEARDITFGIFFTHELNSMKLGSLMRLESVIKRYPAGESDIIVRCEDIFTLDLLLRKYKDKMYPAGDVAYWNTRTSSRYPGEALYNLFSEYMTLRKITPRFAAFNLYQVAAELNLDLSDRYKFLVTPDSHKESFLLNRTRFLMHLLGQEEKSRDVFHLN
jgi:uncharacterized protein